MEQPRSEGTNVHAEVHENGSTTTGNVGNPSVESGSVASPLRDGGESETLNHDRDESGQRAQSNDRNHSAHDLNGELPEFDWQEFEARYTAALKEADDAENKLVEQFDNLGQVFIWICYFINSCLTLLLRPSLFGFRLRRNMKATDL